MSHSHPTTRAERRHQRERVIAARRFIYQHIWHNVLHYEFDFMREIVNPCLDIYYLIEKYKSNYNLDEKYQGYVPFAWGRYAKWNLICDPHHCRLCGCARSEKKAENKKRRIALKHTDSDWEQQYED